MKKYRSLSASPNRRETIWGWLYLCFQLLVLPSLLAWLNIRLKRPFTDAELNFLFFGTNFMVVLLIFHEFLSRSAAQIWAHPILFLEAVILGFVAYWACSWCMNFLFGWLVPDFSNINDASIAQLSRGSFFLTAIGTVVLVPLAEECFYRGLVFRKLYGSSRLAAYLVSMAVFSAIHVLGYLGTISIRDLCLCFLQYLPAGACLAWSYTRADTIFAPIVIHALVNAWGIYQLR